MASVNVEDEDPKMNYAERYAYELFIRLSDCPPQIVKYYALLGLVKGTNVTLEDVHDAWSMWKNDTDPDHKSLIPFDQLTQDIQELDRKYADTIKDVARMLSSDAVHD